MENLLDLSELFSNLSESDVEKIGSEVGISPHETKSALGTSVPLIVSALAKNAKDPQEAENISRAIERDHDGSIFDNISSFIDRGNTSSEGNSILNHILGSKKDTVSHFVGKEAGIDSGSASKLLSMAAPLVMGFLGKKNRQTPNDTGISDILSSFLNSSQSDTSQNVIERLLDKNHDGSITDDLIDMGKGMIGKLF